MTARVERTMAVAEAPPPAIDRSTPTDAAFLAMDRGPVPGQLAAIMVLAPGPTFDLDRLDGILALRIARIPRLRQRLVRTPPGCGRPIWVDDAAFDIRRHVHRLRCPAPGDERALLDTAAELITARLPRNRPLWRAFLLTDVECHGGTAALVIVVNHVLADGIGGLAVLDTLVDRTLSGPADPAPAFPRRRPTPARLAEDALRGRLMALLRVGAAWRSLRTSMSAGGGVRPRPAATSSLNRRTGSRRRLAVVRADLEAVRTAAHRHGATVNDAVLTAVGGALHELLLSRHEYLNAIAVAVPVAGRRRANAGELGNQVAPLLVTVPATGDPVARLTRVAASVAAGKSSATGPPPIALLGTLFRAAAALGGYQWYMNHQRRLHTLVSTVRGPDRRVALAGAEVTSIIPVAVGVAGNVTVEFEVLSYAGTLMITAVADPDHVPDLPTLIQALRGQLDRIAALGR